LTARRAARTMPGMPDDARRPITAPPDTRSAWVEVGGERIRQFETLRQLRDFIAAEQRAARQQLRREQQNDDESAAATHHRYEMRVVARRNP
jgi:hypothetical protein